MKNCIKCLAEMSDRQFICSQCGHWHRRTVEECTALPDFVERIRRKLSTSNTPTFMQERIPGMPGTAACIPPPLDEETMANVECQLEVTFPQALRLLYSQIGNGSFGPGYGLFPMTGEHSTRSMIHEYELLRSPINQSVSWPKGLIPIVDWGCSTYSSIDCNDPQGPIYSCSLDLHDAHDPSMANLSQASDVYCQQSPTFQLWMEWWLDGTLTP